MRNIPLHSPLKHSYTLAPLTETASSWSWWWPEAQKIQGRFMEAYSSSTAKVFVSYGTLKWRSWYFVFYRAGSKFGFWKLQCGSNRPVFDYLELLKALSLFTIQIVELIHIVDLSGAVVLLKCTTKPQS
ncbi:hypothetical protein VNO80_29661 [Phaseolus coccineus]|uniref:Uncharacterized protein n=1 Tax=Phaseolus coccineus TaxID=3886 RepID=A0AAN9LBC9_PHACN